MGKSKFKTETLGRKNNTNPLDHMFSDFDSIRIEVRFFLKNRPRPYRRPYHRSVFYIGRKVSVLRFYGILSDMFTVNRLIKHLKNLFPDFKIHKISTFSLAIYTRGDRR